LERNPANLHREPGQRAPQDLIFSAVIRTHLFSFVNTLKKV
jgi:hypothetical protein